MLTLTESLEESSFFSLSLSFLLLSLLPLLLLLPPPGLGLPLADCLPEPEPPSFLPLLGDLDLRLDRDLDLLLDLERDIPLLDLW